MIRFSLKGPRLATAFLCVALGVPCRTLAQVEAKQQFSVLENSAGTAVKAQLLDEEELTVLSQRNQNPGPEVRGGALSNEHLTYIVIALAAIVLVLVLK